MKKIYFIVLFLSSFYFSNISAQINAINKNISPGNQLAAVGPIVGDGDTIPTIADRVRFFYDEAGNQKELTICINCAENKPAPTNNELLSKLKTQSYILDDLLLYPNPVSEELNIELSDNTIMISQIAVYNMSGQIIKYLSNIDNQSKVVVPFFDFIKGTYIVNVEFSDGDVADFKILKK